MTVSTEAEHWRNMDPVFGLSLLLLMLGVSHGVAKPCDGRQNTSICYGALGGSVLLQLMDDASEKPRFQWKNESTVILQGRRGRLVANLPDKFSFNFKNGTVRIDNLNRHDGGEYILVLFDSNGKQAVRQTLQLIIQAPVSSVQLVTECLSQGEMKVTCSSEGGDSPQYSWTLNKRKLEASKLYFGNHETKNITLKQEVSGELVCTVRNDASSVQEKKEISTCGFTFFDCILTNGTYIKQWLRPTNETLCIEPTTTPEAYLPIMGGILFVMLVLLAVGMGVVYAQKKRQNKPKENSGVNPDEHELTYAAVKIVPRQGRQIKRPEMEVEYGEVKFSHRPRPPVEPAGDECVYSMVRKGR